MNIKLDWNDISIVPSMISDISSRSEINTLYENGNLPLFTAPMDMVIDDKNAQLFIDNKINVVLPRHIKFQELNNDNYFYSYGLDEIIEILESNVTLPKKILIDIAQGHMSKLISTSQRIKETFGDKIELMIGNIANSETYRKYCEIGVDYVRCGIGAGSACTTSANAAVHYPMASLIMECHSISNEFTNPSKIVADGGFKNSSDIIKALSLGADYVMIGSIFNKTLESCSPNFNDKYIEINNEEALQLFKDGSCVYKKYRGMSTKDVQKSWNRKDLKTSEGISKWNKVEYTLDGWTENFTDYLKSTMSYTNHKYINNFIGGVEWIQISRNAYNRFNK